MKNQGKNKEDEETKNQKKVIRKNEKKKGQETRGEEKEKG